MKKNKNIKIAKNVIDLEILALKKLKKSITNSFSQAVNSIVKCQSKIILCGVGKSFLIASKISSTLSSVGSPSFALPANECSHGDLGSISKKDLLILISNSGETKELKPVIEFANRNKITLIGIVSKKNSVLYNASDIKLYIPEVKESGHGIVPTSSTTIQLSIGDALAIALMKKKKFGKLDFKKYHPAGNLGNKLKTAGDLMLTKNKIPFVNENEIMKKSLKTLNAKKLGFVVVNNNQGLNSGIFTDGDLKRLLQKKRKIDNIKIKLFMTKRPYTVDQNTLATDVLNQMNKKKITNVCVYQQNNKRKIIGVLHIHTLLKALK